MAALKTETYPAPSYLSPKRWIFPILMIHLTASIKQTYQEKLYAIKKEEAC